ncbi:Hypothetical predicted protein [Podarcis lilfordi]|uniref:Uncharacterized protein n=1 Tax=Podarcis lilfordi TaxID=74358 RepID=A0AA35PK61_9SAUR|nr:Hypothetical predicted protein [Podarcis lilfordi]
MLLLPISCVMTFIKINVTRARILTSPIAPEGGGGQGQPFKTSCAFRRLGQPCEQEPSQPSVANNPSRILFL